MSDPGGTTSPTYLATVLLSTFLMASAIVSGKILLRQIPPFALIGWRFVFAALATLPLAMFLGRRPHRARDPRASGSLWFQIVAIGVVQTAAVNGLMFWALQWIPAGEAAILLFTSPLWVAVLSRQLLGEHISAVGVVGLLLGIAGVVLTAGAAHGPHISIGDILALLASFAFTLSTVGVKRISGRINPWWLNFWQMLVGGVVLLAAARVSGQSFPATLSGIDWAWFVWLVIPASAGSFSFWFIALRQGGATQTSGYLFLVPAFAVLLGHFLTAENLGTVQVAGGLLIGSGLYLTTRGRSGIESVDIPAPQRGERGEASEATQRRQSGDGTGVA